MTRKRKGQGMLEFAIVSSIVLMLILGMFDLFNISITYMQMAYYAQNSIDKAMMTCGQDKAKKTQDNIKGKNGNQYKPYFFFGTEEMTIKNVQPRGVGSNGASVGTVWCGTAERKVGLLMGKALAGSSTITIKKNICSIQETSNKQQCQ